MAHTAEGHYTVFFLAGIPLPPRPLIIRVFIL